MQLVFSSFSINNKQPYKLSFLLCILFLFIFSRYAYAEIIPERLKVGVVLAGGGAKGAAHIGVLQALEEMHIPVDYIAGTSMGAYVGGLYASGMSASEIESLIYSVDWSHGYVDRVDRSDRRIRDKEYEDRYQITTDLGAGLGELKAPKGVVQGQTMARILRETSGNLPNFDSFDQLAIPFRAVATDIEHLSPVILDKGNLPQVMMASMSVPGVLPPMLYEGRLLVDGGIVNNMPVDVVKAMGADIVIAVDISTDYKEKGEISSYLSVMDQLTNFMVKNSTEQQAELLEEDDVLLSPDVGAMETIEFDKMPEAYELGYQSARQARALLQSFSVSSAKYQDYLEEKQRRRRQLEYGDDLVIDQISLINKSHYSDELLLNRLNLEHGNTISTEELEQSIENLYALDRFERISYQYNVLDEVNDLEIHVEEKTWGPNYLNFRFSLQDDFETDSQYSLGLSLNFSGLSANGAELRTNWELGSDKLAMLELYSPFLSNQALFTTLGVRYAVRRKSLPFSSPGSMSFDDITVNVIPLRYREWVFEGAVGIQPHLWHELKAGLRYSDGEITGTSAFRLTNEYERKAAFLAYQLDTLDDFSLPTKGNYLFAEYMVSEDRAIDYAFFESPEVNEDRVTQVTVKGISAYSYKRHTLVGNLEYGVVKGSEGRLILEPKELGGFWRLSGIPKDSLLGENLAFGSIIYRYKLIDNDFGLFQSPVYIGGSLEKGGVWGGGDTDISFKEVDLYNAYSIFAGINSPIGPVIFGYGRIEESLNSLYLIVGSSF